MTFKSVRTLVRLASLLIVGLAATTLVLSTTGASVSASSGRDRRLHVTKECSEYAYAAGSFCTITSSNLGRLPVGSKIFYDQASGIPAGMLDSNVVLDAGNGNRAVGRCTLDGTTGLGLCTFSDGLGRFAGFQARVDVTYTGGADWELNGTYSFERVHDRD
jgi:hypothetical protein